MDANLERANDLREQGTLKKLYDKIGVSREGALSHRGLRADLNRMHNADPSNKMLTDMLLQEQERFRKNRNSKKVMGAVEQKVAANSTGGQSLASGGFVKDTAESHKAKLDLLYKSNVVGYLQNILRKTSGKGGEGDDGINLGGPVSGFLGSILGALGLGKLANLLRRTKLGAKLLGKGAPVLGKEAETVGSKTLSHLTAIVGVS